MKSLLVVLLVALPLALSAQQTQYPPVQPVQPEQPAQAEAPPEPPKEEPAPGAAPKPGHPLDPADVKTLTNKPETSLSPAQRAGYPPQVYYYYPNDVPLFGYPYGYPRGLRTPGVRGLGPTLVVTPGGSPTMILPLKNKKPAPTK